MGCSSSKSKAAGTATPGGASPAAAPSEPEEPEEPEGAADACLDASPVPDGAEALLPPAVDVPPGTVRFSQQSNTGVDLSVAGDARSRWELGFQGCCWSDEEVSAAGPRRGVRFSSSLSYVMPGLKAGQVAKRDGYADLDYGFYCSPSGRLQIYERGILMLSDAGKYLESSALEIRIASGAVEYVVDGRVAHVSQTTPQKALHFAISWYDHPAAVTGIRYVES